jgi:hypothetical protein
MNVSEFIDLLDSDLELPNSLWTSLMRKEIWKTLAELNNFILKEIEAFDSINGNFLDFNIFVLKDFIPKITQPR